jgi:hypothetical protein
VLLEPDDGRAGGYTHKQFAQAIGGAVERRPLGLSVPAPLLRMGARIDRLLRRDGAKLTADRAAYFCHPDWTSDPAKAPPADLWRPAIAAEQGLAATARWYEEQGWL